MFKRKKSKEFDRVNASVILPVKIRCAQDANDDDDVVLLCMGNNFIVDMRVDVVNFMCLCASVISKERTNNGMMNSQSIDTFVIDLCLPFKTNSA